MKYRKIGRTGLRVSEISLGSWLTLGQSLDDAATEELMATAYEVGVNFFDGGEAYGDGQAEQAMGRVFRKKNWRRGSLILSGKVINGGPSATEKGLNRKHIRDSVEVTLEKYGTDYLDLLFCHRPDYYTSMEETARAMNELIQRGKILYWGTSEYTNEELWEMHLVCAREGLIPPATEQPVYNMFMRERVEKDLRNLFQKTGMGSTCWSPLNSGILSGKYNDGIPEGSRYSENSWFRERPPEEEKLRKVKELATLAHELEMTTAQLALCWCLRNPHVSTVITGGSRPEQVLENAKAADMSERLSSGALTRIEQILENAPEVIEPSHHFE